MRPQGPGLLSTACPVGLPLPGDTGVAGTLWSTAGLRDLRVGCDCAYQGSKKAGAWQGWGCKGMLFSFDLRRGCPQGEASAGIFRMFFSPSQLSPSLSAVSFSSTPSCVATAVWTVPPASRWFP